MTSKEVNCIGIDDENEHICFQHISIVVCLNYLKSQTEGSFKTLNSCLNSYCSDFGQFPEDDINTGYIISINKIIVHSVCKTMEDLISSFNTTLMEELKRIAKKEDSIVCEFEYNTRGSFIVDFKLMHEEYFIPICAACDKISNCINDNAFEKIDEIYTELFNNLANIEQYIIELKTRYLS